MTPRRARAVTGACLVLLAFVAGCGSAAGHRAQQTPAPGLTPAPAPATIDVLHAGMVENLVTSGLTPIARATERLSVRNTKGNSVALADAVKAHERSGDVFISADAGVNSTLMGPANGDWVRWFLVFARNEVVLAYSPKSRFAPQFEQAARGVLPWYTVLEQPDVTLGRDNPDLDPLGYYSVFVGQLAERHYQSPGLKQRVLGDDRNPRQVRDTSPELLRSGQLDAQFMYLNRAEDAGLPYLTLPDEINLGNPDLAGQYAAASYTNAGGHTFRGGPIQVSIAPLRGGDPDAAQRFTRLLATPGGAQLLHRLHFLPSPLLVGGDADAVPAELRPMVQGSYRPR